MFNIARFRDIEKREYECEIVTPLFLGGADPKKAELRAPSIKGALRFWWRALNAGNSIYSLYQTESKLFGSTDQKTKMTVQVDGSGLIPVLKDLPTGKKIKVVSKGKEFQMSIIEYLAFGLLDSRQRQQRYLREHIEPGAIFKICIMCPKDSLMEINDALKAMFSFGGLGSRSRNGLGSIYCRELTANSIKKDGELKPFTAFSKKAVLFHTVKKYDRWEEALSNIGLAYRNARLALEPRHTFTKRGLVAMPIESKFEKNIPNDIRNGRHAKPYFLHVNKTANEKYEGQILFLPYLYKTNAADLGSRLNEYLAVCREMNEALIKAMGGEK